MLDIKLRNRRRLGLWLIAATIFISSLVVTGQYGRCYRRGNSSRADMEHSIVTGEDFLGNFIMAGEIFYSRENREDEEGGGSGESEEGYPWIDGYASERMENFDIFYPFLDYQVKDENGRTIAKSMVDSGRVVTEDNLESYAFGLVITYDENGTPSVSIRQGKYKSEQSIVLRKILNNYEDFFGAEGYFQDDETGELQMVSLEKPKNRTYIFAMTEDNLATCLEELYAMDSLEESSYEMENMVFLIVLIIVVAAFFYPCIPGLCVGSEKIFRMAPFELAVLVLGTALIWIFNSCNWMVQKAAGAAGLSDLLIWCLVFAAVYWGAANLRQIHTLGPRRYLRERTLIFGEKEAVRDILNQFTDSVKKGAGKLYHSFDNLDLNDRNTKVILKLVLCNFVILVIICSFWFYGIMALIVYSAVLFFILRKYFNDLREKYGVLLKATNEMAEGNLDVTITEDLGIFHPFKTEIEKIQTGFKKAVDEEVKSQRMKSELITNVSHDLKTPLTAIITYVNLLKDEKDEDKKEYYIQVLEKKSLRLKGLIEDLFEISKASSRNVTLHMVDVDVVNLFKQVKLELQDKLAEADLDFRCVYPEEKLLVTLDSQKTYRIFENLLVNVAKYALPHTRVYTEFLREGGEVVFRMKNISAAELNFNTEEITERFVRGDASRNTEGSGLGLAIVKSFVELMKGSFKVETEADLFKVEVRW